MIIAHVTIIAIIFCYSYCSIFAILLYILQGNYNNFYIINRTSLTREIFGSTLEINFIFPHIHVLFSLSLSLYNWLYILHSQDGAIGNLDLGTSVVVSQPGVSERGNITIRTREQMETKPAAASERNEFHFQKLPGSTALDIKVARIRNNCCQPSCRDVSSLPFDPNVSTKEKCPIKNMWFERG